MRFFVVVPFLDEEHHLELFLKSIADQHRRPDRLLLVDDGSTDNSHAMAAAFVQEHPFAWLLRRSQRPGVDRLANAPEWRAFRWALEQTHERYDVVAKLDADLRLTPMVFADLERQFSADPRLGIAGTFLIERNRKGIPVRHACPPGHVEGATKFYRRECLDDISPVPPMLGWDTVDEVRARLHGWRTESFSVSSGDPEHLRRMGSYDGILRGFRRGGAAAWGYGAHPVHVLVSAVFRLRAHPPVLCGVNYLAGWIGAALRRAPRAERETRDLLRRDQRARMRRMLSGAGPGMSRPVQVAGRGLPPD